MRRLIYIAAVLLALAGGAQAQLPLIQVTDPRSGFTVSTGSPYYYNYNYNYSNPYFYQQPATYYQTWQVPNQVCHPQQSYYYPQQQYYYQYQTTPQYYYVRKKNGKLKRVRR